MNICLFLCLFVGGVGLLVCLFWFSWCVWLFNCWFVFQTFKFIFRFAHLLSFLSRPRSIAWGAPLRFAHSDSDLRFRFQIQIQISDLRFRFARSKNTSSNPKTIKKQTQKPAQALRGAPLVRFAHSNSDLRFRSQIHIQISDLRFIFARL